MFWLVILVLIIGFMLEKRFNRIEDALYDLNPDNKLPYDPETDFQSDTEIEDGIAMEKSRPR